MTVRQAIFDTAAGYAPFTAQVVGGLYGSDAAPDPPPQLLACPWFYLELLSDTVSFSGDSNYVESGFRWWGYDLPEAGYVRLRQALGTLAQCPAYKEQASDDACPYDDAATGEAVFWQKPIGFGDETADQNRGLLLLTFLWQTRKTFRVQWP